MITKEFSEKIERFVLWLNNKPTDTPPDVFIPMEKLGLKASAPEEAKKAYAEYLAYKKRMRERGAK